MRHKIRQHLESMKPHWGKIVALSPLFFLIFFGYVLSNVTASVLFVERVGVQYLPFIYVIGALLIVLAGLAITSFTEKKSIARVLLTLVGFGLAVFMELYWVITFENTWAYSFFLLFSQTLYLLLSGTLIWNLAVKLCSPFEAKKNFIYYSIGASLGGITAGLLPTFLGIHFSTENYVLILISTLFLAALNLVYLERKYKALLLPEVNLEKTFKTDFITRGFRSFKKIRIVKLLFATLTLFYSISWIADFELQKILSENFEEGRFTELYGLTAFAQSILLIGVLLFLESSLVKKFGVLNVLLSTPLILVPAFIALLFFPTPAVVITAALVTNVVTYSLFVNSSNFVFTALPHNLRNNVSTFIRANADAAAMLAAGAGLLVLSQFLP
ncbi:MAG: MFS transporter, partial [Patescibacteria group bacterium]